MKRRIMPDAIESCGEKIKFNEDTFFEIEDGASIEVREVLVFGDKSNGTNGRSTILRMDKNSQMIVNGTFRFFYGADIKLFSGAKVVLGDASYINSDCRLTISKELMIGNNCAISHDFTVMDSDYHAIDGRKESIPVNIGNHVWIGTRVTILKGCQIGDGCVIGAGSVVTKSFPPKCMIAGVPATIIKRDVEWE